MDHLDWFSPGSADVDEEIQELYRVIAPGGLVFWRSAGKHPWYNKVYGFLLFKTLINIDSMHKLYDQFRGGRVQGQSCCD
jgi:ubiquinone/menaquinone biosynthesis C-methylase UbiE